MSEQQSSPGRILRDPEVFQLTGLSRVQRWRRVRAGSFPAPVQLGPNSIGWREDEIRVWLEARPRVSYARVTAPAREEAA
jgi:prophage regulatory protein